MNLEAAITIPSHVLYESLGTETVLLDMSNGMYFGLTPVASRFWELLSQKKTGAEACAQIMREFDVSEDTLKHDLDDLLAELSSRKLISQQT